MRTDDAVPCPPESRLVELIESGEPFVLDDEIERHLTQCDRCVERLETLSLTPFPKLADRKFVQQLDDADSDGELNQRIEQCKLSTLRANQTQQAATTQNGGRRLGRYQLLEKIGAGGMGEVYRAVDERLQRMVAVKIIAPQFVDHESELIGREAQSCAQVEHPNVIAVYSIECHAGQTFLVMQFIEGESLSELLKREDDPRQLADIIAQICDGMQAAHSAGIIHRDIKPANIMVDFKNGLAKIGDFGLATCRNHGNRISNSGTPQYMSPQQMAGQLPTERSDIYSLGLTLIQALAGELPDEQNRESISKGMSADLWAVCDKATRSEPEQRYGSMADFADDLRCWLRGEPVQAKPEIWSQRIARRIRRHRFAIIGLAVIALVTGVFSQQWLEHQRKIDDMANEHASKTTQLDTRARQLDQQGELIRWRRSTLRDKEIEVEVQKQKFERERADAFGSLLNSAIRRQKVFAPVLDAEDPETMFNLTQQLRDLLPGLVLEQKSRELHAFRVKLDVMTDEEILDPTFEFKTESGYSVFKTFCDVTEMRLQRGDWRDVYDELRPWVKLWDRLPQHRFTVEEKLFCVGIFRGLATAQVHLQNYRHAVNALEHAAELLDPGILKPVNKRRLQREKLLLDLVGRMVHGHCGRNSIAVKGLNELANQAIRFSARQRQPLPERLQMLHELAYVHAIVGDEAKAEAVLQRSLKITKSFQPRGGDWPTVMDRYRVTAQLLVEEEAVDAAGLAKMEFERLEDVAFQSIESGIQLRNPSSTAAVPFSGKRGPTNTGQTQSKPMQIAKDNLQPKRRGFPVRQGSRQPFQRADPISVNRADGAVETSRRIQATDDRMKRRNDSPIGKRGRKKAVDKQSDRSQQDAVRKSSQPDSRDQRPKVPLDQK